MKKIGLHEIRKEFLDFFGEKEHLVAPSFSLVPKNDKSLLLIGAGMAPLKKYFTGEQTPPSKRMVNCQKCIRTGDIDNVGKTDRHATFFEMLGNFSFGDYFKKEATAWAWEFLNKRMEIPKENLWVTIYEEDDEAFEIWNKEVGVPAERIVRLGKEDNFWELEVGPSGPCSEIYVDRGEKHGCGCPDCKPGCECDRFIEVWNLVFTQFDKDEKGVYHPLPNPNIDTGMGLERITCVMEGAETIFDIEAIREILRKAEEIAGITYGKDSKKDESIRVITDHTRAMTFLVSDGVLPSNEGRGYVLRRLIRRAARHGKLLGIEKAFLSSMVEVLINSWKVEYPDLKIREDQIKKIIKAEEDKFQETIHQGLSILEQYIEEMKSKGETVLSGEKAFRLYDTYGFPLDLTNEILEEKSLEVDEEEFNKNMEEQRSRARRAREEGDSGWSSSSEEDIFGDLKTIFKGYEKTNIVSEITGLFSNNEKIESLTSGEEGIIILNESPFYGESGGQVGDTGTIENPNFKAMVLDTKHSKGDHLIHIVKVLEGEIKVGDKVIANVDDNRRNSIRRNHSATHLLHRALKDVLGEHVNQAGSVVMPNRLRFDFTHFEGVTQDELMKIEKIVNSKILDSLEVVTIETSLTRAQEMGVVGLFEDKYKDEVRVLKMGDYSKELCGGTHVFNTANIGMFKIVSESSIASGVRRIEAITGEGVYDYLNQMEEEINEISNVLRANKNNILEKVKTLTEDIKEKEKEIESLKGKMASSIADEILSTKVDIEGITLVAAKVDNLDMNGLRNLGDEIRNRLGSGVVVLGSIQNNKLSFVTMATKDLTNKGIHAGNIIKEVAGRTGGGGGGRPDMAQAGGKDITKIDEALSIAPDLIRSQIK
ncbi:alanine--tRNA ligase [Tissierella sp. MB52-C2]|uniref:alanine--tRNA ligase n=1 Tax=Tissierella sp. MB52-C2 TaxID=3070999 RepID=UPI00280B2E23|nr:alanine--tRNA ligase [Tissierella sp. MB52-C2]WMM23269.1 alanine--tRNA ligase [Tissierella sp. MB52-C2]